MVAHSAYQGPTNLTGQSAQGDCRGGLRSKHKAGIPPTARRQEDWDRALARAHGQRVRPINVQPGLWLCRSSDGQTVYQIRQRSARTRDLACSCPTDPGLVCKHMAAVACAIEDLDGMVDLSQRVRAEELIGECTGPAHTELALVDHRIRRRNAWYEEEDAAIRQLLAYQDSLDPAMFEDRYALDAQTQRELDAILGAEQIELTDEEIALLAAQREEEALSDSDSEELDEALRQQLEDSLNEPDALYLAFQEPWI